MNADVIIHCLKDTTAIDCLACPYFAERKGSITSCRMQRFGEAREIVKKYQKIEQIMKDIPYGGMATVRRIEEVMEDGND